MEAASSKMLKDDVLLFPLLTSCIFRPWRLPHLQFALFIEVEDAFFEVMHLAKDQGFIKHRVVAPQQ